MCGMATKESMIVAPIIVVLYDRAFAFESFGAALRARAPLYAGLTLSWAIAIAVLWSAPRSTVGASTTVGSWTYLLNQAVVITRYLRLTVWPSGLVLDYGLPRPVTFAEALPGGIAIAVLVALALVTYARWPAIGFLATSVFILLAPTSSVIPIRTEVGAERRMYLPLAAVVTLAVIGVRALVEWRRNAGDVQRAPRSVPIVVTGALVAALAMTTIARNALYQNPVALWRADVERRPQGRSRMALATELATAGQHGEAIEQLRVAVTDFPNARAALGTELILQQQFDEGAAVLRRFIAEGPSLANRIPAHVLLAQAFASQGRLDQAEAEWRAVLTLSPGDAAAKARLAQVLSARAETALRQDDTSRGEVYAREAVQLAPHDAAGFNLLGIALASKGRFEEARSYFRQALQIAPDDRQVRNNLERADRAVAATHSRSIPNP
jgi:Flp pilus assembly protein TadD